MEAIVFALLSFVGWGVGDFFVTISARKLNAYSATFWSMLVSVFLLTLYAPFMLNHLQNLTPAIFLINLLLGLSLIFGIIAFREALIIGSSPVIIVISASYAAIATVLSIIFFQERLTLYQSLFIVTVFIGLTLSILDFKHLIKGKIHAGKGAMLALIAALIWGIYFTFIKIPVREIGWFWPNYFPFLFFTPLFFFFLKLRKIKLYRLNYNNAFLPLLASIIFARGAELSFNLGISKGHTSIVAPIAGANPVLFIILAAIFLKDPMTKQQVLGVITTLIGIVLLSIFSV